MSAWDLRALEFQACSKARLFPAGRALACTIGEEKRLYQLQICFRCHDFFENNVRIPADEDNRTKEISSLRYREQLVVTAALEVGEFRAAPEVLVILPFS